jgi:hypothetical protein
MEQKRKNTKADKKQSQEQGGKPADYNPQSLNCYQEPGKTREETFSKILLQPNINAISTITLYQPMVKQADVNAMSEELTAQAAKVQSGDLSDMEAMLTAQARTLDNVFHNLAQMAGRNMGAGYLQAADTYMRLALKAQSQARTTVEALAEIKFPKSATFIKQQNIAQQQQVNNGQPAPQSAAHEKNITPRNELLEASHGERLDTRATSKAGGIDSDLETVGAVHRAQD